MRTVGTRELKQNPQKVIQEVLSSEEEFEITSHGHPTGVRMVAARRTPRRWVPAADLESITPLDPREATAWQEDTEAAFEGEVSDPWEDG